MKRLLLLLFIVLSLPAASQECCDVSYGFSIDTISDAVFARMQGKSFPAGCTVRRSDLRYVRVLHRDALDSVRCGELVVNKAIANDVLYIFRRLFEAHYPIERVRLIDDYDADDERSMADNNTSSFCYRTVDGTRHLSRHALGMAVDVNTLYNPCVRQRGGRTLVSPEAGRRYADRSVASPYRIVAGDLLHRLFTERGFTWGGSWRTVKDYQHFEK